MSLGIGFDWVKFTLCYMGLSHRKLGVLCPFYFCPFHFYVLHAMRSIVYSGGIMFSPSLTRCLPRCLFRPLSDTDRRSGNAYDLRSQVTIRPPQIGL